jgi:hypothetical protein
MYVYNAIEAGCFGNLHKSQSCDEDKSCNGYPKLSVDLKSERQKERGRGRRGYIYMHIYDDDVMMKN